MSIKVFVFIDSIRPDENWLGLVQIFQNSSIASHITIVGSIEKKYYKYLSSNILIIEKVKAKDIRKGTIVFGMPSKYFLLKIINIVFYKSIFINIGPGKITKAIGIHKHPEKKTKNKIFEFVKYLMPHNYYLAADFEDAMYLATAYGRDINFYLPIGLPKSVHIALEFSQRREKTKTGVLFVPTHRWEGEVSVISKWLASDVFVNKLNRDYDIFYNNHPDEDNWEVHESVIRTRELNNSFWRDVDILVTDYSSIAHDFISAGGECVINVTSDLAEFEEHQGKSPLSFDRQFPGIVCDSQEELIKALNNATLSKKEIDVANFSDLWVRRILSFRKK